MWVKCWQHKSSIPNTSWREKIPKEIEKSAKDKNVIDIVIIGLKSVQHISHAVSYILVYGPKLHFMRQYKNENVDCARAFLSTIRFIASRTEEWAVDFYKRVCLSSGGQKKKTKAIYSIRYLWICYLNL